MASSSLQASLHKPFLGPKHPHLHRNSQVRPRLRFSSNGLRFSAIRATSSAVSLEPSSVEENRSSEVSEVFACPVCYEPLIRKGPSGLNLGSIYRSGFKCRKCNKSYSSKDIYLDLTVTAGLRDYTEVKPAGTELFRHASHLFSLVVAPQFDRSPLVSFLYERGWRQNFNRSGFPGPDEEFKMAEDYFKSVQGGLLVDVSCGSGLFSRKFAKSGTYSAVIALDFSENMLRQSYDFIKRDGTLLESNLALVRADVSRLPFSSGSVDAVHAGAALHCWPSPSNAVAEITRILRSGGVFVGTTFLRYTSSTPLILRSLREVVIGNISSQINKNCILRTVILTPLSGTKSSPVQPKVLRALQNYIYLTEEEIEDLCTSCGLTNYSCKVQQSFIMFSAQKP
ncbi:hypothetical protein TIFTF001_016604 [Ficus carica]|uniref:Methyltransferase type 11 domain-containing protein n=1 Tax=Ficus carica TaxID=3494 RepID=A0AA88D6B4_FICCA|nr:hypothetical protein TIFTF001_016604 [Ficus carica]